MVRLDLSTEEWNLIGEALVKAAVSNKFTAEQALKKASYGIGPQEDIDAVIQYAADCEFEAEKFMALNWEIVERAKEI